MKSRPEIDIQKTLENLETPQVSMPGHKEQLKMMLLAQGSLEPRKTGGFISSVFKKTFEVILLKKKALKIAVPVVLLLLAVLTYQALTVKPQAVAAVTLQVNPALTLTLDNKNIVLEAEGENAEGEAVVADYPVKGKELKEALEDLTMHLHDKGFLRPDSEVILTVHPIDGLDQEKLSSLSDFAQQIMSESLNRYNVQKPDSFVISHGLHLFLKELGLMPLDYVELLKANLTEEEIMEVINALGRKDTRVALLPYKEFNLEIESDERELSVEFKQKSYGIYAEFEFEEDGKKDIELESKAAFDYLLPILQNLQIDASMSKNEIVDRVLTAFDWTFSYEEFEIEVKFMDGSYIDFEWETAKTYRENGMTLPYKEFNLEIESDKRELSVDFELKNGSFYAEIEIEKDGKELELEDSAALDYLLPILQNLQIDASMSKNEIVDRVLTAFDWTFSYEEFEIEVKFMDGSYIDFEVGS